LQAELNDVPNNEEITFEVEHLDQRELALDLSAAIFHRTDGAEPRGFFCALRRNDAIGLAVTDRVFGNS
jgi:hypothetical protein